MIARLVCLDAADPRNDILLSKFPVVVGRDRHADLNVQDDWVSRVHCLIEEQAGQLLVRDLASHHGTYVNGRLVGESPLVPGNTLTVGCTTFAVSYERTGGNVSLLDVLHEKVRQSLDRARELIRHLNPKGEPARNVEPIASSFSSSEPYSG